MHFFRYDQVLPFAGIVAAGQELLGGGAARLPPLPSALPFPPTLLPGDPLLPFLLYRVEPGVERLFLWGVR